MGFVTSYEKGYYMTTIKNHSVNFGALKINKDEQTRKALDTLIHNDAEVANKIDSLLDAFQKDFTSDDFTLTGTYTTTPSKRDNRLLDENISLLLTESKNKRQMATISKRIDVYDNSDRRIGHVQELLAEARRKSENNDIVGQLMDKYA